MKYEREEGKNKLFDLKRLLKNKSILIKYGSEKWFRKFTKHLTQQLIESNYKKNQDVETIKESLS